MAYNTEEERIDEPGFPLITVAVVIGLIIAIGVISYLFIYKKRLQAPSSSKTTRQTITQSSVKTVISQTGQIQAGKVFEIDTANFSFSQKEIRVKNGDVVKIILVNQAGMHSFNINEFNAHTEIINEGQVTEVTFLADTQGIFEFYCSIDDHRGLGMTGRLVVE